MRTNTLLFCALLLGASAAMADTVETIPFLALMQPGNEVPAITDTSSANAIIRLHVVRDSSDKITSGSVDFTILCKFSGAVTVTGLHIHKGDAGANGAIVIPTDVSGASSIAVDSTGVSRVFKQVQFPQSTPAIDVQTIQDLLANPQGFYVNIHTSDHPGGAMRGQLMRAESRVLMGLMSAKNEVPPVAGNQTGVATVVITRALDSSGQLALANANFNLEYTGFDSGTTFTGFHIHNGNSTVAGPVIINTGLSGANPLPANASGAGNVNLDVPMSPLDGATRFPQEVDTVNGLFTNPNNYYINIHTTVNPGGAMRDQMRTTDRAEFQVSMAPSKEVPAVTGLSATGPAAVGVYTLRNPDGSVAAGTVTFDINFRGFPANTSFTGLHLHNAPVTASGPIVIQGGVDSINKVDSASGNGNISRLTTVATSSAIAALNSLVQDPSQFYVNIHTTANPGGAERDQLGTALAKPSPKGVAAAASTILNGAPASIVSIYGENLAPITSDLSGLYQPTSLPTTFDGVTATFAGVKAPFYFVSPGQLNVQVPVEVGTGTQPLIVTTAAGASTAFNVTIGTTAPSIFIIDPATSLGAIVKNADFSLVTPSNTAKAGDTVVIYLTGLGQTTPALKTGELLVPPSSGFNNANASVSVTIGGKDATFVYAIAAPGFAGLYQVAVTVPTGVSGNVPVIVKAGAASSNSVNLSVE